MYFLKQCFFYKLQPFSQEVKKEYGLKTRRESFQSLLGPTYSPLGVPTVPIEEGTTPSED